MCWEWWRRNKLKDRIKKIKMILLDMDGVMTDGKIIYGSQDLEIKEFDVRDGFAIHVVRKAGLKVGVISGRESEVVARRMGELGVDVVYQNRYEKTWPYREIRKKFNLRDEEIAYIGDDLFDLGVLCQVGLSLAPADAPREVKKAVHYVTRSRGGQGAVREMIELILKGQGKWDGLVEELGRASPRA